MLQTIKESMYEKQILIDKLDNQIATHLIQHELELESELLQTIPGVGKEGAAYLLAEIGSNMEQFPDEKHLASWTGMRKINQNLKWYG